MDIEKLLNPISELSPRRQSGTGNVFRTKDASIQSDLKYQDDSEQSWRYLAELSLQNWGYNEYNHYISSLPSSPLPSPITSLSPPTTLRTNYEAVPPGISAIPLRQPHSNLRYNQEELDFILFCHDDLSMHWEEVCLAFNSYFPLPRNRSVAGLHSRYYREQRITLTAEQKAELDEWLPPSLIVALKSGFKLTANDDGTFTLIHKIRDRETDEGHRLRERLGLAYRLIEKNPERLLGYQWPMINDFHRIAARERMAAKASN